MITSKINWASILEEIKNTTGEVRSLNKNFYQNANGEFNEILNLWLDAGYDSNKVEWINFYPEKHFSKNIETEFSNEIQVQPIRSWISCVRPGKSAPWHKDVDDNLESYIKLGNLVRYTCFIDKPNFGQVVMIEKDCYYMVEQGKIVKWPYYMLWHGASNCGFENHYLYHFLGYT